MAWISLPGCQSGEFQPESDHVDRCHELCYNKSDGQLSSHVSSCDVRTRRGADNGRPELGTILPTLFLSFLFAVDLLPSLFSSPEWRFVLSNWLPNLIFFLRNVACYFLIVRFLRNLKLILMINRRNQMCSLSFKVKLSKKIKTNTMKIFLIKQKYLRTYIYPLSIFLKEILEKIQKSIISVKRKLSLLKNIPKK